jgi:biopolymer transport protein ExbB/TolQ
MDSPYLPPSSPGTPDPDRAKKRRFWKRMIWGTSIGLLLLPALGVAGTVIGMIRAFTEVAKEGSADPEALAGPIASSFLLTFIGLLLCIPGLVLLTVSIIRFRACGRDAQ